MLDQITQIRFVVVGAFEDLSIFTTDWFPIGAQLGEIAVVDPGACFG